MSGKKTSTVTAADLNLEVIYDELAYNKIMHWCKKAAPQEISGLGNVTYDKEAGVMRVTDVWLLEQENGAATTDINDEAVGKLMYKHHQLAREGEIEGDLKLWWHSHVNMGVFWSGTDMDTIKQLGDGGWFLNSVFNLKEEIKTCVSMTDPMKLFIDDIPTYIAAEEIDEDLVKDVLKGMDFNISNIKEICANLTPKIDEVLTDEWDTEFDDNVTVKTYTSYSNWPSYRSSYHGNSKGIYNGKADTRSSLGTAYDAWGGDYDDDGFDWELGRYVAKEVKKEPLQPVEKVLDDEDLAELLHDITHYIVLYPHFTADSIMREIEDDYPNLDLVPVIKAVMSKQEEEA